MTPTFFGQQRLYGFSCNLCGKLRRSELGIRLHIKRVHKQDPDAKGADNKAPYTAKMYYPLALYTRNVHGDIHADAKPLSEMPQEQQGAKEEVLGK